MRPSYAILLWVCFLGISGRGWGADDHKTDPDAVMRSLMWGDALNEEQLKVAAGEVGMSPERLQELELKGRLEQLIQRYHLPLEISGFGHGMYADEEFRLYKSQTPGVGLLVLNSLFWAKNAALTRDNGYLFYLLLRAQAYYMYRSHYDAEHCAWIVENEAQPLDAYFTVLHQDLETSSQNAGANDPTVLSERDIEFRHQLDPTNNPDRTLHVLIEYALRAVAQKSADNWAIQHYHGLLGWVPLSVQTKVHLRARALSYDFGRARFAMTVAERITFQRVLKTPFRYLRRPDAPSSDPVFDPSPDSR